MADIDNLIAQGPGRRDFAPLGTLFGAWRDGVKARREDEAAEARRAFEGEVARARGGVGGGGGVGGAGGDLGAGGGGGDYGY